MSVYSISNAVRASISAIALAAVLASLALTATPAHAAGGNTFFDAVRDTAGADQLISKTELKALVPNSTYTDAQWATFFARADSYGITNPGTDNMQVERLVNLIIAEGASSGLNWIIGDKTTPITLTDVNMALPAGLAPDKVKDFLLSIPRTPGGTVTREAAEQALFEFVGRDGNKGLGEDGKHVAPFFAPSNVWPINEYGFGSNPVTIVNTANILSEFGPAIAARSGDGGAISVTNSGTALSASENVWQEAAGITARSQGGPVSVVNSGIIGAIGEDSTGILADTNGNYVSGTPSTGNVSVTNSGLIQVEGLDSTGISADSETGATTVTNSGAILGLGDGVRGIQAESGYDIDGERVPDGGVTIKNSGRIELNGEGSQGISTHTGTGANLVENSGTIDITGAGSAGITATTNVGAVTVRSSGDVVTRGADSYGILSASLNMIPPSVDVAEALVRAGNPVPITVGPASHPITIDITGGTIQGGSGGRTFAFPDDGSERSIGSAGILVIGGKDNTISNKGTITALNGLAISAYEGTLRRSETLHFYELGQWTETVMTMTIPVTAGDLAVSNLADGKILGDIITGAGDDSISNAGLIEGNVDLGTGANSISNLAGGVINSGGDIEVGAGNTFTNAGDLSPGGKGTLQQTTIVGNFVQALGGKLLIDIDSKTTTAARAGLTSDVIEVTGRATLAGLVVPNVISIADAPTSEYLIVSAAGGATDSGLGVAPKTITVPDSVNVQDTVAYDFEVDVRAGKDVYLTATQQAVERIVEQASTAPNAGNTQNLGALGSTLSEAEDSASNELDDVLQAVRLQSSTPQAAANALNRLAPQQQSGQTNSTNTSGNAFSNAMLSCASRDNPYKFSKEETCYYAKFTARKLDRDATANSAGHDERGYEVMGGAQVNLGGDLRGGFAFGYEDTNGDTFSKTQRLATSDGQRVHGGFVLKNQWGPVNAYLNIAGSYGWYDHKRFVNMGGFTSALGEQDAVSGLVKLRLSYLNDMGAWYLKPLVDVGATYIDQNGYTETGAGAFNLKVASSSDWLFSISPAIEIGGEIAGASGTLFRPYIRGGVTVFDKDNISFSANFAGAPVGVSGFTVASELDNVFADLAAGVQVLTTSGVNLRLEYDGRFGEHTRQNAGTVKVTMPF